MALHIKSSKSFKILLGGSALFIAVMAATFSVTGIATLFSGYFLTVALMMGALEFSKIVVASFLARYWKDVSKALQAYFVTALIILILVTSAGIFGYLSDAYQKTKGDYTIVEKQTSTLDAKKNSFIERKQRLISDRESELRAKSSNQTRADSLTSRGQNITRTREDIRLSDVRISTLETQITAIEDSVSSYDLQIIELESQNIQGELGPLKYIAGIFDTDMDTVVKYFIFLLIFVFDPLAVLLFVALNTLIRKETEEFETIPEKEEKYTGKYFKDIFKKSKKEGTPVVLPVETIETKPERELSEIPIEALPADKTAVPIDIPNVEKSDESDEFINELVTALEKSNNKYNEEIPEDIDTQHEFYHDDDIKKSSDAPSQDSITKRSANYHPPTN